MSYDKVRASQTIIGTKQAVKAMQAGSVKELFVALDADNWAISFAREIGIPIILVESKKELGKACGIHVGAAVVAIAVE